jgi:WD40 repeat protein
MPSSQKTFRVFVSSTFTDMRAERRILQKKVFPDLKKYCEARGASFQAVDLRWGVNEESQREQKTMEICLTEIARCQRLSPRPNFIVLLGDRYGWQPVPNKIPSSEMAELQTHLNAAEKELISKWYQEDTNAIPPEYVLKPRGDKYRDYDRWQPVEDSLRATLRKAVDKINFSMEQRIKYFASATHQEIINGALQAPATGIDPADHVFAYLRKMEPPPQGEKAGDFLDLLADGTLDPYAKDQMESLKEELGGKISQDHIYKYPAQWHEGVQFDKGVLDVFAAKVYHDLISVIDQELQEITATDELTREKKIQDDFAKRLTRFFTGQEEPRREIAAYLEQGSGKPLAVIGPSGSGKSSLIAKAIDEAKTFAPISIFRALVRWYRGGTARFSGVIIFRFIGATSASSNPYLLLRQVCEEIAGAYNTPLPSLLKEGEDDKKLATYEGLREIFPRCLALATEDQPLLIFLDALDQLQSHRFDFLPDTLPRPARIVVSALPELEDRLSFAEVYRFSLMQEQDGEELLGKWLAAEARTLTREQRQEIIGKFSITGLPLYLKLAFEQACQWHSYEVGKALPAYVEGILARYFDLLEKEHTKELVGKVAGYFLSGKYRGLTEAEITGLLVFDPEYWESFLQGSHPAHRAEIKEIKRLPFVVWSRLFLDLEPYLTERDADGIPIITFYHGKFMEYARERYLATSAVEEIPPYPPLPKGGLEENVPYSPFGEKGDGGDLAIKFHATLAGYFETLPLYLDAPEQTSNVRKVVEQPYQQTMAGRWESLADHSLSHFPFLMAKARVAMVEGILEDYRLAFGKMPQEKLEKLRIWEAFFRERAHILRRGQNDWPAHKILLQLAIEHADDSPVTQGAEHYLAAGQCDWPWLRRERRPEHAGLDPCLAVLEGHTVNLRGALALPDGRILSWSGDHTLRLWDLDGKPLAILAGHTAGVRGALALPDGRLLSWSDDTTLRLWDLAGKPLAILAGHTDEVRGALALSDGRLLSWSGDHTLRLWNRAGKPLSVLEGHTDWIEEALALPDGRLLSWSGDHTLRLWDLAGKPLAILAGHTDEVRGALALSDGRLLSWSGDHTLRLWDRAGKPLAVLEGHTNSVWGALVLPDGRLLSWSGWGDDKTLRLWDRAGKPLAVFKGHTRSVNGALVLADGRILSWSPDRTLRLWDRAGKPLAILEGHSADIWGALVLSDGRLLSWSQDQTLRVWDRVGKPLAVFEGHSGWVWGALALSDGRLLSWSGDETLRLWDLAGKPLVVLRGHTGKVNGAFLLSDGRILSWSEDHTLRFWDRAGEPLAVLEGHRWAVKVALALSDRRILSWSWDKTLRLWDRAGKPLAILEGHSADVWGALALPGGRILSWSGDKTLRLWDQAGEPLAVFEGHVGGVKAALALSDGRILSWSDDETLRLWDQAGKPLAVLEGHTGSIIGALVLSDGRILSWSQDQTLRLWDRDGELLAVLEGHTNMVSGALALSDGRILSWSADGTLRLWDRAGKPLAVFKGHTRFVKGALVLPDGRILSWSGDKTLKLWDKDGKPLEVYGLEEGLQFYPEAKRAFYGSNCVGNAFLTNKDNSAILAGHQGPAIFWQGASRCAARLLQPDGRAVVTQDNGQVCFLQLYHGNRPITLDELEANITVPTRISAGRDFHDQEPPPENRGIRP